MGGGKVWCAPVALLFATGCYGVAVPMPVERGAANVAGTLVEDHEAQQLVRRESKSGAKKPEADHPDYKLQLNKVVQSSPDNIDLNGEWITASGMTVTIKGGVALGPPGTGYKEKLAISNAGRRIEMNVEDEKTTYWALLNGRGSLNWNDGDVWWRKIDCLWAPWSLFGACGGPCPNGMQQRRRGFEFLQENGGTPCRGAKEECRESAFCQGGSTTSTTTHAEVQ